MIILCVTICILFVLAACGMSTEDMTSTIDAMQSEYRAGSYNDAYARIEELDKAYEDMGDEQKTVYGDIKEQVEYAYKNAADIDARLAAVGELINRGAYEDADKALGTLISLYTLPPAEQAEYDSFENDIDEGIRIKMESDPFYAVEAEFNKNNYSGVIDLLENLDENTMTEEQKETHVFWRKRAEELSKLLTVQSNYDQGKYSTAASILSLIDPDLLNDSQRVEYDTLKHGIDGITAHVGMR